MIANIADVLLPALHLEWRQDGEFHTVEAWLKELDGVYATGTSRYKEAALGFALQDISTQLINHRRQSS